MGEEIMNIRQLLKDYEWKDPNLKKRYRVFDFGALIPLILLVVFATRVVVVSTYVIYALLAAILVMQWYCWKLKKQDQALKEAKQNEVNGHSGTP